MAVTTSSPSTETWHEGSDCGGVSTVTAYDHVASIVDPGTKDSTVTRASWRRESDCTWSGQVSETTWTRKPADTVEWESVTKTPRSSQTHAHTLSLLNHSTFEDLKAVIDRFKGSEVGVSVSVNDDCTVSGTVHASKLVEWATDDDGDGFVKTGTAKQVEYMSHGGLIYKKTATYNTVMVRGKGNESNLVNCNFITSAGPFYVGYTLVDEGTWQVAAGS